MKSNLKNALLFAIASLISAPVFAADAALQIHGDLMIHPNQVADFFTMGGNQIRNSSTWNWPALQFTAPYKTSWTNVVAHGPFNIAFDTSSLKTQEVGFTMTWADPTLSVGLFEIHDQIKETVNGIPVIVNLDGSCSDMSLKVPGGQWAVSGKMHWDFVAGQFVMNWESFNLAMNSAAVPQLNLGQCQGVQGLINNLNDSILKLTTDQAWLQDTLKAGVHNWVTSTLGSLQSALLTPHEVAVKNMKIQWSPSELSTLGGGLIRVAGTFNMTKPGSTVGADQVPRNYDPLSTLSAVNESGFVMPKDSLQHILNYMYSNGELQYRVNSSSIPAFVSLMNSWFMQLFVWPDLMSFPSTTAFWFDLGAQSVPELGAGGVLDGGGSTYPFSANMLVHQWAPSGGKYVPYVDFMAPVQGNLTAAIKEGKLTLKMTTGVLNIVNKFRSEFKAIRFISEWVSTWLLSSSVQDYLNTTSYSVAVPTWQVGTSMALTMKDIQVYQQTFRVPLQFTTGGGAP